MKTLDKIDHEICQTQGDLYEQAANEGYRFPLFSNIYLQSDFCRRAMDTDYSRFQIQSPGELMDFIIPENPQINEKYEKNKRFDGTIAFWIGYMYRYLYFATGLDSKNLLKLHSFNQMCAMYPGMHTVDYEMAAEMIMRRKV